MKQRMAWLLAACGLLVALGMPSRAEAQAPPPADNPVAVGQGRIYGGIGMIALGTGLGFPMAAILASPVVSGGFQSNGIVSITVLVIAILDNALGIREIVEGIRMRSGVTHPTTARARNELRFRPLGIGLAPDRGGWLLSAGVSF